MPSSATVFASSSSRLRVVRRRAAERRTEEERADQPRAGEKGVGVGLHGAPVGGDRLVRGTRQRARADRTLRPARVVRVALRDERGHVIRSSGRSPSSLIDDGPRLGHVMPQRASEGARPRSLRGRLTRFASSR